MAGCGPRTAGKMAVAAVAATIAVWAGVITSPAAQSPVQLSVQVGYHDSVKLGQWTPVEVDARNQGPQFDGSLEIATGGSTAFKGGGPPGGVAMYDTPVTLAPGATKHFRTYVSPDQPGTVDVRLSQGGRIVASQQVSISNTISGLMVAVLSDDPSALDGIATIHPGGVAPAVIHLAAADLPDSSLVLRAFDLIAVDNFATDTLTTGQRNALVDYVMQGGALLISTGGSWHKTLAGLPEAIVPMRATGSTILAGSTVLGAGAIEVATGALAGGATAWLAEGDQPLVVESPVGLGFVNLSTFDWAQAPIAGSAGAAQVLRQLVVRATFGNPSSSSSSGFVAAKGGITTNSLEQRGGTLSQALGNVPALDLPAWWLIGSLVLVYVLLVGPINYFVLRAAGRRALAWITVPAIALVASGVAYGASVATKGTSVVANEISIAHLQPGWTRAYNEEYTGIVTPTRGDYDVGLGGHQALVSPIYYYNNPGDPNLGLMQVNTATGGVTLPSMSAFTLRGFATEGVGVAPAITASVKIVGGQIKGTINNGSALTFSDGVIIAGNAYQMLGELKPGGAANLSLQPAASSVFNGNPPFMQIYPSSLCCGGPPQSDANVERLNEIKTSVLSTLTGSNFGGVVVSAAPMVVLWTREPIQDVSVNGGHPRTYVATAVVLTLPVTEVGAGPLAGGVVGGRLVDLDASLAPAGPPGLLLASSGSATYSFSTPLAAGTRLTNVSLSSSNPYGPKFAGPGASQAKGQLWDWTASTWTDVSYSDTGTTPVPSSDVNPNTGEVRLRISSDGQYTIGFLSLSGTVA